MAGRTVKVVVTGATGQVAYALLPRIAAGEMFGPDTEVDLRLSDIPQMIDKAKGVVMELEDGAYPLLARVSAGSERGETHKDIDWALLVGSKPRGPGMERNDLIRENGPIFVAEGRAIAQYASPSVRIAVVGNPCNTNCLIARHAAGTGIADDRWTAMTRLDQNRARAMLAAKAGARVRDVTKLVIWGNHSATLYPDFTNALVGGRRASDVVDRSWLEGEYLTAIQQRGAAIIAARGASSAFSAAQALVDHVKGLVRGTDGDWASLAVVSDGSYDVPKGLVSSFPVSTSGNDGWQIVKGIQLDSFARSKVAATVAELEKERAVVQDLLAGAATR
jgi:malate dehydrogenase